jgi:hypothetical protein
MAVLRERVTWQRTRRPRETAQPDDLTSMEAAHVRRALRFLRAWIGSWTALAKAMGIKRQTLKQGVTRKRRQPTAGFALRAAKVAKVRVESILTGKWPSRSATPTSWRTHHRRVHLKIDSYAGFGAEPRGALRDRFGRRARSA